MRKLKEKNARLVDQLERASCIAQIQSTPKMAMLSMAFYVIILVVVSIVFGFLI